LSEYLQFLLAMVLMVAILIGAYWFVIYSPAGRNVAGRDRDDEPGGRRRGTERPEARRVPRLQNEGDRGPDGRSGG
jgi:hypothetical protein